ncbi:MAG: 4-alpha-glucanotransferase [Sedimentisphaerales bacterium]|nr:4-alpha-glucanotransferase [Sedimentisphaerales bacterium]
MLRRRSSGILLHITSLPSKYGVGDFGPEAYQFVDFLSAAGQSYWQVLPLNDTTAETGYSPYNCLSAFAGNPQLISPDLLVRSGLLTKSEIRDPPGFPADKADYQKADAYKRTLLDRAFERFRRRGRPAEFEAFTREHQTWLDSYAAFVVLKRHFKGKPWCDWPADVRDRKAGVLRSLDEELSGPTERERFSQYIFYTQYCELKRYCNEQGVQIAGDIPIYVAYDSADVWSRPDLFRLNRSKRPRFVAGVPPDYFSRTGQLWGNPVYDWQRLEQTRFHWWIQRMKHNLVLFDFARIDHFRGLVAYWEVPAHQKTAIHGKWVQAPHGKFLRELFRQIPFARIFVEDLGYITADVREVVSRYNLPRMVVLQFAFGDDAQNPHLPHNHVGNSIVYTGTHDNNTTRGWFDREVKGQRRKHLFEYLGYKVAASDVAWELMRMAMQSVARIAIIPMQDVLGLGAEARMNTPAKRDGNWLWRMQPGQTMVRLAEKLRRLTETSGRA